MNFREKLVAWEELSNWRASLKAEGRKLVVTNGCFDLLHVGHVTYLQAGPNRPVNSEADRAAILAALESVGGVCIFQEKRATRFLDLAQPDIYVKGGDYTLETLDQDERRTVEQAGGRIVIIPFVPGKSTTATIQKLNAG